MMDAWAAEACDGMDDDGDREVDESPTDCREAPFASASVCVDGNCVCRASGVVPRPGDHEDCNGYFSDGCETPVDTETNCGGCGVHCDIVSRCTDGEGGVACRPVGILDLTTARPRGDIACIVTVEHEVVCRGPNTEHAISDVADETAVLDWTRVDLPDATAVRAWQRERPDGRSVLSICAIAIDGQVVCRGDNGTGLLGYGDTMPRTGNHVIALSGAAGGLSIWGGDGYALLTTATRSFDLVRWTADATPALWQNDIEALMIADMPFTRRVSRGSPTGYYSWGTHTGLAAGVPPGSEPWATPTLFLEGDTVQQYSEDHVCSTGSADRMSCSTWDPTGGLVIGRRTQPPEFARRLGYTDVILFAPASVDDPRPFVCIQSRDGESVFCDLVEDVIASTISGPAVPMTEHPERAGTSRLQAPTEWQAMCRQHRPDWWECWGSHTGWNNPPRP